MKKALIAFAAVAVFGSLSAASASAALNGDLHYGLTNDVYVIQLQTLLKNQGIYTGPTTGNFFGLTQTAVKIFQAKNGLPVTGYVGPLTRNALNSSVVMNAVSSSTLITVISEKTCPVGYTCKPIGDVQPQAPVNLVATSSLISTTAAALITTTTATNTTVNNTVNNSAAATAQRLQNEAIESLVLECYDQRVAKQQGLPYSIIPQCDQIVPPVPVSTSSWTSEISKHSSAIPLVEIGATVQK